jgi:hypothetical protein
MCAAARRRRKEEEEERSGEDQWCRVTRTRVPVAGFARSIARFAFRSVVPCDPYSCPCRDLRDLAAQREREVQDSAQEFEDLAFVLERTILNKEAHCLARSSVFF